MAETAKKEIKNEVNKNGEVKKEVKNESVKNEEKIIFKKSYELSENEISKLPKYPVKLIKRTNKGYTSYSAFVRFSDHVQPRIRLQMDQYFLTLDELKSLNVKHEVVSGNNMETIYVEGAPVRCYHMQNGESDYKKFNLFLTPNLIASEFFSHSEWILVQKENKNFKFVVTNQDSEHEGDAIERW